MTPQNATGPGAGVLKYDILTSLSVAGLNGTPGWQTSMMRLISLVTARYNWQRNELTVGQREMAKMWSVNERTVKREIKRLTGAGVLVCKRSGVRGRVGAYTLNIRRIAELSESVWPLVGPDFEERMRLRYDVGAPKVVPISDYARASAPEVPEGQGPWHQSMTRFAKSDPGIYKAWFAHLEFNECADGTLTMTAPSKFIQRYIETHLLGQLAQAVEPEFGQLHRICIGCV